MVIAEIGHYRIERYVCATFEELYSKFKDWLIPCIQHPNFIARKYTPGFAQQDTRVCYTCAMSSTGDFVALSDNYITCKWHTESKSFITFDTIQEAIDAFNSLFPDFPLFKVRDKDPLTGAIIKVRCNKTYNLKRILKGFENYNVISPSGEIIKPEEWESVNESFTSGALYRVEKFYKEGHIYSDSLLSMTRPDSLQSPVLEIWPQEDPSVYHNIFEYRGYKLQHRDTGDIVSSDIHHVYVITLDDIIECVTPAKDISIFHSNILDEREYLQEYNPKCYERYPELYDANSFIYKGGRRPLSSISYACTLPLHMHTKEDCKSCKYEHRCVPYNDYVNFLCDYELFDCSSTLLYAVGADITNYSVTKQLNFRDKLYRYVKEAINDNLTLASLKHLNYVYCQVFYNVFRSLKSAYGKHFCNGRVLMLEVYIIPCIASSILNIFEKYQLKEDDVTNIIDQIKELYRIHVLEVIYPYFIKSNKISMPTQLNKENLKLGLSFNDFSVKEFIEFTINKANTVLQRFDLSDSRKIQFSKLINYYSYD